jgi:hypothetical protein
MVVCLEVARSMATMAPLSRRGLSGEGLMVRLLF